MPDHQTVSLQCPHCGHETKQSLAWLDAHATYACPGCGEDLETHGKAALEELQHLTGKLGAALDGDIDAVDKKLSKLIRDLRKR